jgi:anthranilate/para-aminobenzoate synthase component II
MAVAHTELPAWGVQFHPESMLSRAGLALLANFLAPPAD